MKRTFWLIITFVCLSLPILGGMWLALGSKGLELGVGISLIIPIGAFGCWGIWHLSKTLSPVIQWYFRTIERFTGLPIAHWGKYFEHLPEEQIRAAKPND